MRREDIAAYVNRDWDAIAEMKRRRWAQAKARMTPAEVLRVGDRLRRYVRLIKPHWPTADLATHIRVSEALRSVRPGGR